MLTRSLPALLVSLVIGAGLALTPATAQMSAPASVPASAPASVPAAAPGGHRAGRSGRSGPVVVQADPFTHVARGLRHGQIELDSLSARPDLVSGDAVRFAVRGLTARAPLTLLVDGRRSAAPVTRTARGREVVVRGLRPGRHVVSAVSRRRTATLVVTAHGAQQPLISGRRQEPFVCHTADSGFPGRPGRDCAPPPVVHWWWRDASGQFHRLEHPRAAYPAGVATTTVHGRTVPFVVRVENVVLERSITRIAVLDDPHARGARPFRAAEWNHDLVYHFGESCGTGFQQGTQAETDIFGTPTSLSLSNIAGPFLALPDRLGQGWMAVQSSLTIFGVACNAELSADVLSSIEQHVWTDYGDLDHVVGGGGSGGAVQQVMIANQYPGLLTAITPILSFPDTDTVLTTGFDCDLLDRVFQADPLTWTPATILAVTGFPSVTTCHDWVSQFETLLSPASCPAGVSDPWRPTRPTGTRCAIQDDLRNVLGTDRSGRALRPLGNEGVLYGWRAYRSGALSAADFVRLNQEVGGIDGDGVHTTDRTVMAWAAARRAYATGQISGRGALDDVPIIDQILAQAQETPVVDIHDADRPFQTRARLDHAYGGHGNQSIWDFTSLPSTAIPVANHWLDAVDRLRARHPGWSQARLVVRARPAGAGDRCEVGTVGVVPGQCDRALIRTSPRQVAGGPTSEDVLDCHLRALPRLPGLTAAQQAALGRVFPHGVCDWSRRSIGDTRRRSETWVSYGSGTTLRRPRVVGYPAARSAVVG